LRTLEVQANWENGTREELRVAMEAAPNRRSDIRLQALRALLLGFSRHQVGTLCARSDRLVRLCGLNCSIAAGLMRCAPSGLAIVRAR
jgi:hypothetical protein